MYCPECGDEAGEGNFCRECGADLHAAAGGCPRCGADVAGANFCPECGKDLGGGSARSKSARSRQVARAEARRKQGSGSGRARQAATPAGPAPRRTLSPALIWGGFAVAAAVVVLVVFLVAGGNGAGTAGASTTQPAQPVAADTSGGYSVLVQRANGLYDQGSAAFQAKKNDQAVAYFTAAAKVYGAAWKQQATDPNVGTDYATSLFYSGDVAGAVKQVDRVLAKSPGFQTAWFNKGNYLAEKARLAEQSGQSKAATAAYAAAKAAYTKAVSLDRSSQVAGQAQQQLGQLPR